MSKNSNSAELLQFIQIIIYLIIIACQAYAFMRDNTWTTLVKSKNQKQICPYIVHKLDNETYNELHHHMLENPELKYDKNHRLQEVKLGSESEARLYKENIVRNSYTEKVACILSSLQLIILTAHLITACWSTNSAYRTNWTAIVQGYTVFASGFAAILIAISANHFAQGLELLAIKFPVCSHFLACSVSDEDFKNILENEHFQAMNITDVRKKTQGMAMCQEYEVKMACTILSGVTVALAFVIICHAMDLKTLYDEEDVDEEERARRENFNFNANKTLRVKASKSRNVIEKEESVHEHQPEVAEP